MVRYDTGDTGKMRVYYDKNGRVHAKYTEIYGRRGSLMYNTKGEPLSIHVFMNTLLKFEGTVYQAKCIQWREKDYELLVNADRSRLDETELLAAYRHYLGEDAELRITYVDQIPNSGIRVNLWSVKINGMEGSRHNETESIGLYSGSYSRVGNP